MSSINWVPGVSIAQDPDAIRDYTLDFTTWLEGDTIATANVVGTNCTAAVQSNTTTGVAIRISAVELDASATVTITTSNGQSDQRTVNFHPVSF